MSKTIELAAAVGHFVKPTFEYEVHTREVLTTTGEKLDVLEFLNSLGKERWQVKEVTQQVVNSGMLDDKQQPIPKIVVQALTMREVDAPAAEAI